MADDKKNPLDVLEELLGEAGGGAGKAPVDPKKAEEEKEAKVAAELQARRDDFEQKKKDQAVIDEQLLKEQLVAIQGIKDHDQYKAREVQEKEKAAEKTERVDAADGYEISQLSHKKI